MLGLRDQLSMPAAGQPLPGPTVVVAHMAPASASVAPRYLDNMLSSAFASDLEDLVAQADVGIHGHMHDSFGYSIGACRSYAIRGAIPSAMPPPENPRFDPRLVVEIAPANASRG
jgi:hypothetical protein